MGRRKKKKKKRKLYNKREFTNIFCEQCNMCCNDPIFCYNDVYREYPNLFIKEVIPTIIEVNAWNGLRGISIPFDAGQFRYIFCNSLERSNACGPDIVNCENFERCYELFKSQVYGLKHKKQRKIKRKKKKKTKYIAKPYPTLIMSENDEWNKFVKDILSDGNIDKKQDTIEAGAI